MPTKESFSEAAQVEIVDSLEDARESHESAMEALKDSTFREIAAHMAYSYGNTLHAFMSGAELSNNAMALIRDALKVSVNNCVELDLEDAANSYMSALAEVRAEIRGL